MSKIDLFAEIALKTWRPSRSLQKSPAEPFDAFKMLKNKEIRGDGCGAFSRGLGK
ncbi:hypothetical protein [Agrobacterium salinitolerans]|uniref:hypothetical protein n=1 Tax=Agrobacterium salinitolerans TaxID=1183413 RepID=UPI0022B83AC3|nr:hypothetical protein [Agrobacterium salinitolerans]